MDTPKDMGFKELLYLRLDNVKLYNTAEHYEDCVSMAKRWSAIWGELLCSEITTQMIMQLIQERSLVSSVTANKEIRYLRATFNFGKEKNHIEVDPTNSIDFLPVDKNIKYVPSTGDIDKVINAAGQDTQDFFIVLEEAHAHMDEITQLVWENVNFDDRTLVLNLKKKGVAEPASRKIQMTAKLYDILLKRSEVRDHSKPWVFWHRYWSRKFGKFIEGPYVNRKHIDSASDAELPDAQDYLLVIRETVARMKEVNNLTWDDVNFDERYVVLYTRKKKRGDRTPRKIPMTEKLYKILSRRFKGRNQSKPWVFWHRYWSRKASKFVEGPYISRNKIMNVLCKRAGVRYFRYHALRHAGASLMDSHNVPLGSIQRILGHENRKTTEIYLHSIGQQEKDAMDVFEKVRVREKSHTNPHMVQLEKEKGL
jgi:integrase